MLKEAQLKEEEEKKKKLEQEKKELLGDKYKNEESSEAEDGMDANKAYDEVLRINTI